MSGTLSRSINGAADHSGIRSTANENEAQAILDNAYARKRVEVSILVKSVLGEHLGHDPGNISDNAHVIDDLEADSLDLVELAMAYEDTFGIRIPDDDIRHLRTVKDTIKHIVSRI